MLFYNSWYKVNYNTLETVIHRQDFFFIGGKNNRGDNNCRSCCLMIIGKSLRHLDGLGDFLLLLGFWHGDGQDAVLYLRRDLVTDNIVRQRVVMLIVRVAELTTQIVMVLVLMLVLLFILDCDGQQALIA